jgi:3-mercaptopyruvate sulfurtransferase SseA
VNDGKRELIFSCGSGMTAGVGWLGFELVKAVEGGKGVGTIYDEVSL